jgi:methylated-DNA-[protein]-cysteine S-methyltransferase
MSRSRTVSAVPAHLFPTALGTMGIAWGERGIRAVELPGASDADLVLGLREKCGTPVDLAEPPPSVRAAAQRMRQHVEGDLDPLRDVALDEHTMTAFARKVHAAARKIAPGRTASYSDIAQRLGAPGAARAVGQALGRNPFPLVVPCHRVLAADGGLGGFSAFGSTCTKLRLLTIEGADLGPIARAGVRHLARTDPKLGRVIRRVGPYRLREQQRADRFTALAEAIVHQQVSMKAGAAIFSRLREAVGSGRVLRPEALRAKKPEVLRRAGLSRQKVAYLADLADKTLSGALPLERLDRLDDEQVIGLLTQVKGIGRWSAEMFLMFRLGRLDVLPVADLGLRKGAQRVHGLPELPGAADLRELGARWAPYRSIATWYLWRSLETGGM